MAVNRALTSTERAGGPPEPKASRSAGAHRGDGDVAVLARRLWCCPVPMAGGGSRPAAFGQCSSVVHPGSGPGLIVFDEAAGHSGDVDDGRPVEQLHAGRAGHERPVVGSGAIFIKIN